MKYFKKIYIILTLLPLQTLAYEAPSPGIINSSKTLRDIINAAIGWSFGIIGSLAILFIIYGGFQYITSGGSKEKAEEAKKTLTYAIGGLLVVLVARIIVALLSNTIESVLS